MGFLDHSTNNIIVDAVLTDKGRAALARNDGSFNIFKFGLSDDEVDYSIIQQYGRTVGKEKIEKNTPIMEALTIGSLSMKYNLLSISNEYLVYLPQLTISDSTGNTVISLAQNTYNSTNTATSQDVSVKIANTQDQSIPNDLIDSEVRVEVNDLFVSLSGKTPDFKYSDNIAVYTVGTTSSNGTISADFTVLTKSFSTSIFNTYSVATGEYIRTYMTIAGLNSGVSAQKEIQITQ